MILLLSSPLEFNLHKLRRALQHRRVRHAVLDTATDRRNHDFSVHVGDGACDGVLATSEGTVPLAAITGVWTRGIGYAGSGHAAANSAESLILAESAHGGTFLWYRLSSRRWVNPLPALDVNRLVQCDVAVALGLEVPPTIVSTRGDDIRDFVARHGDCIVKPVSQGGGGESGPAQVMTSRFPADAVLDASLVAPVLVQQAIAKHHELRVVVIGDRVFAGAIDSAADARSSVDSRAWVGTDLTYYRVRLGADEERSLIELNARLGCVYSSMDLIRTPDGRLVFLEANPAGQWTFLESHTGFPITDSLVDYLCSEPLPRTLPANPSCSGSTTATR